MENNHQYSGVQPMRPPMVGSVDPRSFVPLMPAQFRPVVPPQQSQQFIPVASHHFQPVVGSVPMMNVGLPPQSQQPQHPQQLQHLPPRPGQLPPQGVPLPMAQQNMHVISGSPLPQPTSHPPNNYTPGLGGPGMPLPPSYSFAPSSYGQVQVNFNAVSQYQPQMHPPNISAGGQLGLSETQSFASVTPLQSQNTASVTPVQQTGQQHSITTAVALAVSVQPTAAKEGYLDWIEHKAANGRRYYFNKKTRQSTWEKPLELMTPIERVDASTDWKEFTSPDGRKYYYNKVTGQSKWTIPEELKLAREQVENASVKGTQPETLTNLQAPSSVAKSPSGVGISSSVVSSPVPVSPVVDSGNPQPVVVSPAILTTVLTPETKVDRSQEAVNTIAPLAAVSGSDGVAVNDINRITTPMNDASEVTIQEIVSYTDKVQAEDKEEVKKDELMSETDNDVAMEEKVADKEPLIYANKLEAKIAFKALLESSNVGSDWNWDRAMRVIINDRRYGALKSLGERKQVFNEFLSQKKKQEVEERRVKQKKAHEEFKKMLEECKELTSSTRWSKAVTIFEDDERFNAIERDRDRKDIFETYLEEVGKKARVKAQEDRKHNIMVYRNFLESCDFIKANTQWRKVQDHLEEDERCSRLEKIDRLEIFQDYLRDLEKEEEEQRKIQKEELRKAERKNRDEFRKLMEEHISAGALTAKTYLRDYYMKVKDLPAYLAVSSNSSGSTAKDLFEDVVEELKKQYNEDRGQIKELVKYGKITVLSSWTLDDFKAAVPEKSHTISDINIKLVFEELLERAKEKEEKEAKRSKRLADGFFDLLCSIKEITPSSKWEDAKELFEGSQEYSSIGDDSICRGVFEEYMTQLTEHEKENDRKRKEEKAKKEKEREDRERKKMKHRREKERGAEREKEEHFKKDGTDDENDDSTEIHPHSESRRSGKDSRKHRKRHQSDVDNTNENDKDRSRSSHRHSSDRKKSRRHASSPESDSESRLKKQKRERWHKNGEHDDLEDGEYEEDGAQSG